MQKIFISILCCFFLLSCSSQRNSVYSPPSSKIAVKKTVVRATKKPIVSTSDTTQKKASNPIVDNIEKPRDVKNDTNTEILVSTSRTKVTLQTINNYVLQYKDIAMGNMQTYGIPASIILAQGILESGAGSGDLAISANNHFGIKCHKDWVGESVRHDDDAAQECFRKYPQSAESFKDHALFLTSRGRYSNLFKLPKNDYKAWARGLRTSGYATDPRYPEKLITYIEKYALQQYDNQVLGILNENAIPDSKTVLTGNEDVVSLPTTAQSVYEIQKGDTLYSLSKKFSITIDELREINKIADNTLSVGQKIKTRKS